MPPMVQRLAVEGSTGKNSPSRLSRRVQLLEHDAGLDRDRCAPRGRSASRALRCRLKSTTSPAPIGWPFCEVPPPRAITGTPCSRGDPQRRREVVGALREDHAGRHDLVDRGVGRVAPAREGVEAHLALERPRELPLEAEVTGKSGRGVAGERRRQGVILPVMAVCRCGT